MFFVVHLAVLVQFGSLIFWQHVIRTVEVIVVNLPSVVLMVPGDH